MQPRFPGSPASSHLLENIINWFAVETKLSVFFQVVPQAISRSHSTEENFQLKSPTHPRMLANYFELYWGSLPALVGKEEKHAMETSPKVTCWRVYFCTDYVKAMFRRNPVNKSDGIISRPTMDLQAYLSPSMSQISKYSRNQILKPGLSNMLLTREQDRNMYYYRCNMKK